MSRESSPDILDIVGPPLPHEHYSPTFRVLPSSYSPVPTFQTLSDDGDSERERDTADETDELSLSDDDERLESEGLVMKMVTNGIGRDTSLSDEREQPGGQGGKKQTGESGEPISQLPTSDAREPEATQLPSPVLTADIEEPSTTHSERGSESGCGVPISYTPPVETEDTAPIVGRSSSYESTVIPLVRRLRRKRNESSEIEDTPDEIPVVHNERRTMTESHVERVEEPAKEDGLAHEDSVTAIAGAEKEAQHIQNGPEDVIRTEPLPAAQQADQRAPVASTPLPKPILESAIDEASTFPSTPSDPPKRKRGRPLGSKNKIRFGLPINKPSAPRDGQGGRGRGRGRGGGGSGRGTANPDQAHASVADFPGISRTVRPRRCPTYISPSPPPPQHDSQAGVALPSVFQPKKVTFSLPRLNLEDPALQFFEENELPEYAPLKVPNEDDDNMYADDEGEHLNPVTEAHTAAHPDNRRSLAPEPELTLSERKRKAGEQVAIPRPTKRPRRRSSSGEVEVVYDSRDQARAASPNDAECDKVDEWDLIPFNEYVLDEDDLLDTPVTNASAGKGPVQDIPMDNPMDDRDMKIHELENQILYEQELRLTDKLAAAHEVLALVRMNLRLHSKNAEERKRRAKKHIMS
ncbi:hypothetical protein CC1G_04962 [Coprinopsis cinerea okayama7|uniref:Uncharacterized protein n=1 Tax=Coprinopsis cinerea (strain Okayama-7 / 130 / ATCC MYA-4618 / FGSC 9003) TaxID=240176 RepID=A8NSB2_COPC7|nr:hypothetical protein CC1G_04962 [Coprinopsis cinerea okayama7\|eukprot:XP_001835969.1 hypothetical protein CC1G_04962 [Coprinopsis cinerea okayama7\